MNDISITSGQYLLEELSPRHLVKSRHWANDKRLNHLILRSSYVTPQMHIKWYRGICQDDSKQVFAVINLDSGNHIGNTGFYNISEEHKRAEFWILLGESGFWGKGVGTQVLRMMMDYGFSKLGLNKIHLFVSAENIPAIRLYTTNQFVTEGTLRQHYFINEKWVDILSMSILRSEYELQKQSQ